ncbi:F-box protein [Melia azedarach]|uniref:F-box protein n=1 Tax=Melia azedarach TaxID=155640 RepID=A0ACC1XSR9_MELAZ|nr:F-box protein [Melia azedarach]
MVTSNGNSLDDTTIEILSRLPVKSLIRFRCVCKSWYSLVKDPNFIYKHLRNDDNIRLTVRYTVANEEDEYDDTDSYFSFFPDETLTDLSLQKLDPQRSEAVAIVGPYDGIFCLFRCNTFITLWNIATKEYRVLPKCKVLLPHYTTIQDTDVAFGFDFSCNAYKLVSILTLWDKKRRLQYELSHIVVYNLSTNSWRGYKGFEMKYYYMNYRGNSTCLNGVCYWIVLEDFDSKVILSFDMKDEVFQEIKTPCNPKSTLGELALFNDSLSLLVLDEKEKCFDLWLMKERCWTKQFTVGPLLEVYEPLALWKKDSFFVESSNGELLLYDTSTQEMRDLGLRCLWFSIYIYRESLITLKGEDSLLGNCDIPWHILGV